MKSVIIVAAMSVLTTTGVFAAEQTWRGVISDKMCGANHKSMGAKMANRECTQACAKDGTPYVLVADGKVYQLNSHDADLRTHAGHAVNLTGELRGDAIRVSKIEMPAPPAK